MSNEYNSVHDFDVDFICEYFSNVQRQGPGSPETTVKALSFIDNLTDSSRIADLGCGTGGQTIVLARSAPGQITGMDLFPKFIDLFKENAARLGLQDRVHGIVGSIDNLPFGEGELDLIWSEGAIYNIGFRKGLEYWNRFIKKGGYVAVSEATWFTDERPAEIDDFWMDAYPEIDTIPNKVAQLQAAGYIPVANFILPVTDWTEHFYAPQAIIQEEYLRTHAGNKTAEMLIDSQRHEMRLYHKYKDYYGYVFYIGKKL